MAPPPTLAHQDVVSERYRQLANALMNRPCRVYVAPVDVRLPSDRKGFAPLYGQEVG
jgi:hypothetical protein